MSHRRSPASGVDVQRYLRLLLRQKWFVLFPALLGAVAFGLYSRSLQDLYSAKATILVEPQSLPKQFMSSALPYGPETYVRSLVEQVKSRSRLEQVIKEFNLYPQMRAKKTMEEVVAQMRRRIEIERRGQETFSISFTGSHPETVKDVTNRITEMFIDEALAYRLERSSQNVEFLESQAKAFRERVFEQERMIQAFKAENLERLPEQRMANQVQLNAAEQRLLANTEALASARARRMAAQDRLQLLEEPNAFNSGGEEKDPLVMELERAKNELASLRSKLTGKHPDVKIKQKEVHALEARVGSRGATDEARHKAKVMASPEVLRSRESEQVARAEIVRLQREGLRLEELIQQLHERLEQTPGIELQLSELANGLDVLREQADSYQKKATDAAASLEMERGNQGSQFRALDLARRPHKPVSPNRPMLVLLGAAAGMGLGILLIIGLDLLFRPFLDEDDLAQYTGLPVLVSIPHSGAFPSNFKRMCWQVGQLLRSVWWALPFYRPKYVKNGLLPVPPPPIAPGSQEIRFSAQADEAAEKASATTRKLRSVQPRPAQGPVRPNAQTPTSSGKERSRADHLAPVIPLGPRSAKTGPSRQDTTKDLRALIRELRGVPSTGTAAQVNAGAPSGVGRGLSREGSNLSKNNDFFRDVDGGTGCPEAESGVAEAKRAVDDESQEKTPDDNPGKSFDQQESILRVIQDFSWESAKTQRIKSEAPPSSNATRKRDDGFLCGARDRGSRERGR